jgi:hypothetical protein
VPKYPITWVDYRLPTGKEFSVAICGNEGRVCQLFLKGDIDHRSSIYQVDIEEQSCNRSHHCLALDCLFNSTSKNVVIQMLGLTEDETLDQETSKLFGTQSTTEGLMKFIKKIESSAIWGEKE